jgi:hypothetical protein
LLRKFGSSGFPKLDFIHFEIEVILDAAGSRSGSRTFQMPQAITGIAKSQDGFLKCQSWRQ